MNSRRFFFRHWLCRWSITALFLSLSAFPSPKKFMGDDGITLMCGFPYEVMSVKMPDGIMDFSPLRLMLGFAVMAAFFPAVRLLFKCGKISFPGRWASYVLNGALCGAVLMITAACGLFFSGAGAVDYGWPSLLFCTWTFLSAAVLLLFAVATVLFALRGDIAVDKSGTDSSATLLC